MTRAGAMRNGQSTSELAVDGKARYYSATTQIATPQAADAMRFPSLRGFSKAS
jgi:hypothetical protein